MLSKLTVASYKLSAPLWPYGWTDRGSPPVLVSHPRLAVCPTRNSAAESGRVKLNENGK